jgi:hypothetical protein
VHIAHQCRFEVGRNVHRSDDISVAMKSPHCQINADRLGIVDRNEFGVARISKMGSRSLLFFPN